MVRPFAACIAFLLPIALGAPIARAEPVSIGGSIQPSSLGTGNYQWTTLLLSGAFFFGELPRPLTPAEQLCTPCSPGQVLDLSTSLSLSVDGQWASSPQVVSRPAHGEGQLSFHADPIVVPTDPHDALVFGVEFPFTATGFLTFTDLQTSEVIFRNDVAGAGVGRLFLSGTADPAPYAFKFVYYTMADPVPEPASMLLSGTGMLWLARYVRNRRRRARTEI